MTKRSTSKAAPAATEQIGRDGWFTLSLSTLLILIAGGLSLLWLGRRVLHHARNAAPKCDTSIALILVPGMRLTAGEPNPDFRLRLQRAQLLHQQHGYQLLLLGGTTAGESLSEAASGQQFLIAHGVPASSIGLEDRSRNTLENLHNAREQLHDANIKFYALISNRYHLARCQALAAGLGMSPALCAAEEHFRASPSTWPRMLLEAYYLHWYYTGKLWSRITGNRHSLARIS
jgi:uncharacterized SAM-binding protein YcdF (DUF218 family)